MDIKMDGQVRGTRLLYGEEADKRRSVINRLIEIAEEEEFREVVLPSLEKADTYADKAGADVLGQMYTFDDRKGRRLCLRPEGTATCQLLARSTFKGYKDLKLWYVARCWRYERPQAGRYREFTQFGLEVLNPRKDPRDDLIQLAERMVSQFTLEYSVSKKVQRGLAYYVEDGFEIKCPKLGAQEQVMGGGRYAEGIGFAVGVDRLMLV